MQMRWLKAAVVTMAVLGFGYAQAAGKGGPPASCMMKCTLKLGECAKPCQATMKKDPACISKCLPDFESCQNKCPAAERDGVK